MAEPTDNHYHAVLPTFDALLCTARGRVLLPPTVLPLHQIVGWHMFPDRRPEPASSEDEEDNDYMDGAEVEEDDDDCVDGSKVEEHVVDATKRGQPCTVRSCTRKILSRGMCTRHCGYRHPRKRGVCKVEECDNRVTARGMCARHCYGTRTRRVCRFPRCNKTQFIRHMCSHHARTTTGM